MVEYTMPILFCPQCGLNEVTRENLQEFEGCCESCWTNNQNALDEFNYSYDYWNSSNNSERDALINWSYR